MGKKEKQLLRLLSLPKDYSYDELKQLMKWLDYFEDNAGKSSGSRVAFRNAVTNSVLKIHKPHPENILKQYQLKLIIEFLTKEGKIH